MLRSPIVYCGKVKVAQSVPIEDHLESEAEYLRHASFEGLGNLAIAATVYFCLITVVLYFSAPASALSILLTQKLIYMGVLGVLAVNLKRQRISSRHFHVVTTCLIFLCMSSALVTASFGMTQRIEIYTVILIIGCALMEVSYRWVVLDWILLWACWFYVGVQSGMPSHELVNGGAKIAGMQLLAIATFQLRIHLLRKNYKTLRQLAESLAESERVRNTLDLEVERRTLELQMAYEELSLSIEQREKITEERERLHAQLLHSQKMESLGRLAGGVAHDFNNLLTVIIGNLELAMMSRDIEPDVNALLSESNIAARRAADLTGQLLAFSRSQMIEIKPFKVQKLIAESVKMAERLLGEDIELQVSLECPDAVIEGDPTQIQQILMNLVVNSSDAMPQGGSLRVRLWQEETMVILEVSDTGVGISKETQERIFEPFFTEKPVGHGTGLGLSTVHGVVTAHGGRIELDSSPKEGTTFTVYLPLTGGIPGHAPTARSLPPLTGTGSILLVEDDEQVRNLSVRALELSGYRVTACENGAAALKTLEEKEDFDMLLTDVVMPGMDGAQLARKIRERLRGLPILFMSGYTDEKLSSFEIRAEGCSFLGKPFTPLELQKAVAGTLSDAVRAN